MNKSIRVGQKPILKIPFEIISKFKKQALKLESAETKIKDTVTINYFSQDPLIQTPELKRIGKTLISDGPENKREIVSDIASNPKAKADLDGNYIYTVNDPRFDQVESLIASTKAIDIFEKYLGREIPWRTTKEKATIFPHSLEMANAYYDTAKGEFHFGYFNDPVRKKTVQTSQSQDIVAHETAHAMVDSIRPNYHSGFSIGSLGTHESIGDIAAIITALTDEALIDRLLTETGGNLKQKNLIEAVAEEVALGIKNKYAQYLRPDQDTARHALNDFTYKDQKELPFLDVKNDDRVLGTEHHSYSRLFTGAFYDMLESIFNKEIEFSLSPKNALTSARDISASLILKTLEYAPWGDISFKELAKAVITTDSVDKGGKYQDILRKIFLKRNLLNEDEFNACLNDAKNIPALNLPENLNSIEEIISIINQNKELLGVRPQTNLIFKNIYYNNEKQIFVNFESKKTIQLSAPQFEQVQGALLDIKGGLTLAFDKSGKLIAKTVDEVTPEEIENIKENIIRLIKAGLIGGGQLLTKSTASIKDYLDKYGNPYVGIITSPKIGIIKLVRSPIIS